MCMLHAQASVLDHQRMAGSLHHKIVLASYTSVTSIDAVPQSHTLGLTAVICAAIAFTLIIVVALIKSGGSASRPPMAQTEMQARP